MILDFLDRVTRNYDFNKLDELGISPAERAFNILYKTHKIINKPLVPEDRMYGRAQHIIGVTQAVERTTRNLSQQYKDSFIQAALFHDIGYFISDDPFDHCRAGARWAKEHHFSPLVCDLILTHCRSDIVLKEAGYYYQDISEVIANGDTDFQTGFSHIAMADASVSHLGEPISFSKRHSDLGERYGYDSSQYRCMTILMPILVEMETRIKKEMA